MFATFGATQCGQVGSAVEFFANLASQRTDVGTLAALHADNKARCLEFQNLYIIYIIGSNF